MPLEYLKFRRENMVHKPLEFHKRGLQYTASGYGGKIPTEYMLLHDKRLKRIYCMQYSNLGTPYILSRGNRLILQAID